MGQNDESEFADMGRSCQRNQGKTGPEVTTLKATSFLFARMLLVARSSRDDINMEEVIGNHEFSHTNRTLIDRQPRGV